MVYHETRIVNGKTQNYLVYTKREEKKIIKKSKFIGYGKIPKKQIEKLRKEFELEVISSMQSDNLSKEQIMDIEKLRTTYHDKISSLSREEFEKFENTFFTELTYDSNAIEGSSLSLEDTNLVINEGIVPKGKTLREINEAKNHIDAIKFINNYNGDLDEQFILKLHSIILNNISERFAGRYRETTVRIFRNDVSFPDASKVAQLVGNLVYWYKLNKNKIHHFELAVLFSAKLVSIHPFIDGNGRISRLIMNFLLSKKNYPWINIYMKQRSEYLHAVRLANDEKYKPLLEFCINTLKKNLKSFNII
ncbi:cell filamentation protein Fic [Candidatus Pacearchaeota archaeon CG10_big_fil_rev_8_21_14_0_10_35_13]|nr:MAG: cell filamentation protein Fic [Candidatus Pacearchaeota archaeon CG10_big_fil_rev_8_21_14_0_10_35_13]